MAQPKDILSANAIVAALSSSLSLSLILSLSVGGTTTVNLWELEARDYARARGA